MAFKFNVESEHLPVNRSAAFYRKIVNGIQDLVLVLAQDGRILFASSACQSLTAFPPRALVGNLVTTFMHHDDLPIFLADFKNCFTAGKSWTFHHRIRRQDDSFAVFESAFKPYHDTEISKSAGLTGIQLCLMTTRPYSTPCTTKMDTFLEQWTNGLRLSSLKRKLEEDLLNSDSEDDDLQNDWPSTFSGSIVPTTPLVVESTNVCITMEYSLNGFYDRRLTLLASCDVSFNHGFCGQTFKSLQNRLRILG